MRFAAILMILLAGCGPKPPVFPKVVETAPVPVLAGQITLLPGDGRVYVLKNPDPLGIEVGTCLLHVSASGPSAMACLPPRIELPPTR